MQHLITKSLSFSVLILSVGCSNQYSDINLVCKGFSESVSVFGGERSKFSEPTEVVSYKFTHGNQNVENLNSTTKKIDVTTKNVWTVLVNGKDLFFEKNTIQKEQPYVGEISSVDVSKSQLKGSSETKEVYGYLHSKRLLSFEIDRLSGKWVAKSETHFFHKENGETVQSSLNGVITNFNGTCESIKTNKL